MKYRALIGAGQSGSIGGITASHNRGGIYYRTRATPVNPRTVPQLAIRGALALASSTWGSLSASDVGSWNAYAAARTITDVLGEPIQISGIAWFNKLNVPRLQALLPMVLVPPASTTNDPINTGLYGVLPAVPTLSNMNVVFDATDAWANEDDAALLVFVSQQKPPNQQAFVAAKRAVTVPILGDSMTPPTSPIARGNPFGAPYTTGYNVWWRMFVTRADGLQSDEINSRATVP